MDNKKKLGNNGLGIVWEKVFSLIQLITGNVDVSGKGNLQKQIIDLEESIAEESVKIPSLTNNLLATEEGTGLDATQGKALKDLHDKNADDIAEINSNLSGLIYKNTVTVFSSIPLAENESKTATITITKAGYTLLGVSLALSGAGSNQAVIRWNGGTGVSVINISGANISSVTVTAYIIYVKNL